MCLGSFVWCNKPQTKCPKSLRRWLDSHRPASVTSLLLPGPLFCAGGQRMFEALHYFGGLLTEDRDTGGADVLSLPALGEGREENVCTQCWGSQPLSPMSKGQLVGFLQQIVPFLPSLLSQDPFSCPLNSMWSSSGAQTLGRPPLLPYPLQLCFCSATYPPRLSHGGARLALHHPTSPC